MFGMEYWETPYVAGFTKTPYATGYSPGMVQFDAAAALFGGRLLADDTLRSAVGVDPRRCWLGRAICFGWKPWKNGMKDWELKFLTAILNHQKFGVWSSKRRSLNEKTFLGFWDLADKMGNLPTGHQLNVIKCLIAFACHQWLFDYITTTIHVFKIVSCSCGWWFLSYFWDGGSSTGQSFVLCFFNRLTQGTKIKSKPCSIIYPHQWGMMMNDGRVGMWVFITAMCYLLAPFSKPLAKVSWNWFAVLAAVTCPSKLDIWGKVWGPLFWAGSKYYVNYGRNGRKEEVSSSFSRLKQEANPGISSIGWAIHTSEASGTCMNCCLIWKTIKDSCDLGVPSCQTNPPIVVLGPRTLRPFKVQRSSKYRWKMSFLSNYWVFNCEPP